MKPELKNPQARRAFLTQLGVATAVLAGSAGTTPLAAQYDGMRETHVPTPHRIKWDTSWIDRLSDVSYRVVFDANNISDGFALDLTATFLDHYHEVHGTADSQMRAVIVMRQLGTPLALGDAIWEKYALGEELKINDRATRQPARRNPFLKPHTAGGSPDASLETLRSRGTILLLCNIAMNNWSSRHAEMTNRSAEDVKAEVRANLVPGTIVVPSGIFALIRAQNAGCAFMRGS
ncbi:MAG: hypothetical protein ACREOG_02120 [Gemmatimonadaceae bacterium]